MLSEEEKNSIRNEFPNVKLSYENIAHNKVYFDNFDVFLAVPMGKKCFAWFTNYNGKDVCFVMEIGENKQIENIRIMNSCFNQQLSYGTIFYGTLFKQYNSHFFTIEDILFYKGTIVSYQVWSSKFALFKSILENDLEQVIYNPSFIAFGLPLLSANIHDLKSNLSRIKYKIASIQMRQMNKKNVSFYITFHDLMNLSDKNTNRPKNIYNNQNNHNIYNKQMSNGVNKEQNVKTMHNTLKLNQNNKISQNVSRREIIFKVKPDIQNDIYHLYCVNEKVEEVYFDVAYIPDFKTSVMMNKLFRNIKENENLDALEESDDEEEFENEKEDRFVYLDKMYYMVCQYNYKFKKWYPLRMSKDGNRLVNINEIK